MSYTSVSSSTLMDSILVEDYLYSVIKWDNIIKINNNKYYSNNGNQIANISNNNISFLLLKIEKSTFNITSVKQLLYEFSGNTYDIPKIKIKTDKNKTKINILVNTFFNNEDVSVIYANSGLTRTSTYTGDYYSGITHTYNGTTLIEQDIRYLVNYVQFENLVNNNFLVHISKREKLDTIFIINEYITLKNMEEFDGRYKINDIYFDISGNCILYLTLPSIPTKYPVYDSLGNLNNYYEWENIGEIVLDDQTIDKLPYEVTLFESLDTINITDIIEDESHSKTILCRYKDVDFLQVYSDYANVLLKYNTFNDLQYQSNAVYITELSSSTSANYGPIISELVEDENNNLYSFGLATNFDDLTEIQVGDFSPFNPPIIKTDDVILVITKFTPNRNTIWNKTINLTPGSIFSNPKLLYSDNYLYLSFSFIGSLTILEETYISNTLNSIFIKIDIENSDIKYSKFLSSTKLNNITDFVCDDDYIYIIGKIKGESKFDNLYLFENGDSGYYLKMRKSDGLILNVYDFYSDDKLITKSILQDEKNIYISGSWRGNIYINDIIRYSYDEEFFITNIKKNDI